MLEFLKGYNKFHIYDRAKNAELTLKAFDAITPMATFVEAVMKAAYAECYGVIDKHELKGISLDEMFNDDILIGFLKRSYSVTDTIVYNLDNNIRRKSNFYKHDVDPFELTEAFRKDCFKSIYLLAAGYYKKQSGRMAPAWSDKKFSKLYDNAIDESAREKLGDEVGPEIEALNKELASLKREKTAANKQIEELTEQLNATKLNRADEAEITELRDKVAELEKLIDDADGQSVILKEEAREAVQQKIKAEKELDRLTQIYSASSEEQSQEAKEKLAKTQRALDEAQKKADDLDEKNSVLEGSVQKLLLEKQRADRKIAELVRITADGAEIAKIERKLLEVQAKKEEIQEELSKKERKLEEIEKLYKLKKSELDRLNEEYQQRQRKITEAQQYLEKNAPRCPHCDAPMKFNKSKFGSGFYWNCPNYSKDGNGCPGGNVNSNNLYNKVIQKYYDILGDIEGKGKFEIPESELDKFKTPETKYSPYPESFSKIDPPTYLFQSISVPREVFRNRHENRIDLFSKFYISTNIEPTDVAPKLQTIYSLALRLLNRGIVLPESKETGNALRTKFNRNDLGAINWLYDSYSYTSPYYPYDSTREKAFAEYYFPKLIGENWATFVFSQAGIDVLVPGASSTFSGQKVDFYLYKNGRKVVIELDGPEHQQKKYADQRRDRFLQANGYIVRRYSNIDVDAKSGAILQDLRNILGENQNTRIDADVDNRYLVASKLCHQFAVAIVKCLEKGYIGERTNLKASANIKLFSESEVQFILSVAVAEVYSILKNYAVIYNCKEKWNFFDDCSPVVNISAGEGNLEYSHGIMIRDCTLPHNILCEIEDFAENITPQNVDEGALEFFLDYLFDYSDPQKGKNKSEFKPGQFNAIKRLIEKKDTIVLLPTGSGKSTIYQLSSFIVPGLVVVVSPLISLIEDQVQNLERKRGITNTIYFASTVTQDDKEQKEKSRRLMQHNATTLIYLAPERLMIPSFREDVGALLNHNSVYAVAIDEAHCVSEWGHDFRPAYLNVGNAARQLFMKKGDRPVISALTGTASDAVLNDVRLDLGIRGNDALIQPDTFDRPELHFSVKKCEAKSKDFNIANIIRNELPSAFGEEAALFSKLQGKDTFSGIVFTPLAKKRNSQYSALVLKGSLERMLPEFGIAEYFSETPKDYDSATWKITIRENARKFKDDELNLLVATKAFGMGIDKPNIRFIIHDGLPSSFEQYYQEAGRAGRDGEESECILLFSNDNEEENERLLNPEIALQDFKEAYSTYSAEIYQNDSADDVSALLYFHNGTFKGIESETEVAGEILDLIEQAKFEENKTILLTMPLNGIEKTDDGDRAIIYNKNDREKDWIQALVRLLILGIITDYTYDYRQNFKIKCGKLDKEYIVERYGNYVSGNVFDKNRIYREKSLIQIIDKTGIELAKSAIGVLVNYIYDNIEQSRRRAIHEMFDAVKQAAEKDGEEQNLFLRNRITQYFKYKGENRDALKSIELGEYAGLLDALSLFDLLPDKEEYSNDEKMQSREIYVLAGRVLESKPDHPGLLLAQAIGRMISGDYNENAITSNIMASIRYAKERYLVAEEVMKSVFFPTFNAVLMKSPEMFDEVMKYYADQMKSTESETVIQMLQSDRFGDSNREYLLAYYATQLLNKFYEKRA